MLVFRYGMFVFQQNRLNNYQRVFCVAMCGIVLTVLAREEIHSSIALLSILAMTYIISGVVIMWRSSIWSDISEKVMYSLRTTGAGLVMSGAGMLFAVYAGVIEENLALLISARISVLLYCVGALYLLRVMGSNRSGSHSNTRRYVAAIMALCVLLFSWFFMHIQILMHIQIPIISFIERVVLFLIAVISLVFLYGTLTESVSMADTFCIYFSLLLLSLSHDAYSIMGVIGTSLMALGYLGFVTRKIYLQFGWHDIRTKSAVVPQCNS